MSTARLLSPVIDRTSLPDGIADSCCIQLVYAMAFVLLMLDATGISVFAALRALLLVGLMTLALSTALTWLLGDRHLAAVVTLLLLLAVLVMQNSLLAAMVVAAPIFLVVAGSSRGRGRCGCRGVR